MARDEIPDAVSSSSSSSSSLLKVVNEWNKLGRHVVSAETVGSFKKRLDECMAREDRWFG